VKGRKGIGKFAGLVAADIMEVCTQCRGESTRLRIVKEELLRAQRDLEKVDLPVEAEPCDARVAMLSLAAPLLTPPAGAIPPAAFLQRLEPSIGSLEEEIRARVAAVHQTRRGELISYADGSTKPLEQIATAEELQKSLMSGAVWVDKEMSEAPASGCSFLGNGRLRHLDQHAGYGWHGVKALSVSPILSKLYQESGLRDPREA